MEIRTSEEVMENITNYAKAIMDIQIQKKVLDGDISDIKQEAKENGVAIGKVLKVLNKIKATKKQSESDILEEELILEGLERNIEIDERICVLTSK